MPWSAGDAERFKKGLNPEQKARWAAIANAALKSGSSESSAVRQASGSISSPGKIQTAAKRRLTAKMKGVRNG